LKLFSVHYTSTINWDILDVYIFWFYWCLCWGPCEVLSSIGVRPHCHLRLFYFLHIAVYFSETTGANGSKLRRHLFWMVLDIICDKLIIRRFDMAARPIMHSDWLKVYKSSSHKPYIWWNCNMLTQLKSFSEIIPFT